MKKDGYYSSGEFARMAHVTLRTVRYYDKQDILKPSLVTESGARFYTDEDFARLQQILLLKYLGFSLDDIREMTIGDSDYHFMLNSLNIQLRLVRDRIEQMQLVEKAIQDTAQMIKEQHTIDWSQMLNLIHLTGMEKSLKNQYQNATNISSRINLHSLYSQNKQGWFPWIFEQCRISPGLRILELGCGKGGFISQLACAHPENNYLGIDITDKVLILAKRKIEAAYQAAGRPIDNVKIMSTDIERIKGVITPEDEVSRIYINFCNPWSKNDSSHKHRLTYPRQLIAYREFLKDGGEIYFKTDDDDLFRDSVEYFPASGYDIEWITYDLHENEPEWNIRTEHEGMFTEMGIKIKALIARKKPGSDSVTWVDPKVLKRMAREAAAAEAAAQEGEGNV